MARYNDSSMALLLNGFLYGEKDKGYAELVI